MLIWERFPGLTGLTIEADRPGAERVFRVRQGKLVDSTLEFCPQILSRSNPDFDQQQQLLSPQYTERLTEGSEVPSDVASALLSLALQHTFCGRFDKALHYLNLWPRDTGNPNTSRSRLKKAFGESIK